MTRRKPVDWPVTGVSLMNSILTDVCGGLTKKTHDMRMRGDGMVE